MSTELDIPAENVYYRVKDPDTGIKYTIPDMSANHDLLKIVQDATLRGGGYTPEQKISAAALWTVLGSSEKVSRITGLPARVVRTWYHEPWWHVAIREVRKHKNEEMDATLTGLLEATMVEISDRLQKGETVVDKNTGELRRVPVNLRTLATTLGVMYDKRALLRGDPTSKVAKVDVSEHLSQVAQKLEKLVGKIPVPEVVDGEFEEVVEDGSKL